jgi:hypothetical protein
MTANIDPIYSRLADVQWGGVMTAAIATADITSGTSYLIFTADATNGGFVRSLRLKPVPGGNNVASVARIWINNGSTTGTASNSTLFSEVTLPAITSSATAAQPDIDIPLNMALPAGYKIYVSLGTAVATGWVGAITGGKY